MRCLKNNKVIKLIFFGNYFYGICAIALAIEASLQQNFPLPDPLFFLMAFSSTLLYYSKAYLMTENSDDRANLRSMWYARNNSAMRFTQSVFLWIFFISFTYYISTRWQNILNLSTLEWIIIFVFPLVSVMYYGVDHKFFGSRKLRNVGWLKPFIIGYTWAGMVTIYPVLFYCIDKGFHYEITFPTVFLFVKNFMFITLLCILFDIKDYAMDYNQQLKTLVVNIGLRKTIFFIIIPLCFVGLGAFLIYADTQQFSNMKILLNTIPFLGIISVAYSMYSRRSIFYYLMVIDGLMLLKAICGTTAMIYF